MGSLNAYPLLNGVRRVVSQCIQSLECRSLLQSVWTYGTALSVGPTDSIRF